MAPPPNLGPAGPMRDAWVHDREDPGPPRAWMGRAISPGQVPAGWSVAQGWEVKQGSRFWGCS